MPPPTDRLRRYREQTFSRVVLSQVSHGQRRKQLFSKECPIQQNVEALLLRVAQEADGGHAVSRSRFYSTEMAGEKF